MLLVISSSIDLCPITSKADDDDLGAGALASDHNKIKEELLDETVEAVSDKGPQPLEDTQKEIEKAQQACQADIEANIKAKIGNIASTEMGDDSGGDVKQGAVAPTQLQATEATLAAVPTPLSPSSARPTETQVTEAMPADANDTFPKPPPAKRARKGEQLENKMKGDNPGGDDETIKPPVPDTAVHKGPKAKPKKSAAAPKKSPKKAQAKRKASAKAKAAVGSLSITSAMAKTANRKWKVWQMWMLTWIRIQDFLVIVLCHLF